VPHTKQQGSVLHPGAPSPAGATARSPSRAVPRPVRSRVAWSPAGAFIAPGLTWGLCGRERPAIPRKEVIQPQLPLRLPCYDFVPITSPTLDGCVPEGFAHRLQVLPAFMT
jgi:hypothetical protein